MSKQTKADQHAAWEADCEDWQDRKDAMNAAAKNPERSTDPPNWYFACGCVEHGRGGKTICERHAKWFAEAAGASVPQEAAATGIALIAAERQRQIDREGWTPEHDDAHRHGEMAVSAARYALVDAGAPPEPPAVHDAKDALRDAWRWQSCWWKPKDPIRNLARAGALIAAEIDRRLRLTGEASCAPQGEPSATEDSQLPASNP